MWLRTIPFQASSSRRSQAHNTGRPRVLSSLFIRMLQSRCDHSCGKLHRQTRVHHTGRSRSWHSVTHMFGSVADRDCVIKNNPSTFQRCAHVGRGRELSSISDLHDCVDCTSTSIKCSEARNVYSHNSWCDPRIPRRVFSSRSYRDPSPTGNLFHDWMVHPRRYGLFSIRNKRTQSLITADATMIGHALASVGVSAVSERFSLHQRCKCLSAATRQYLLEENFKNGNTQVRFPRTQRGERKTANRHLRIGQCSKAWPRRKLPLPVQRRKGQTRLELAVWTKESSTRSVNNKVPLPERGLECGK